MTTQTPWNSAYNNVKGSLLVGNGTRPIVRTVGTNGQVLTANSANADGVEWATPAGSSGFTSIVIRYFGATATYTPTAGMKYCIVELIGGGGAGGGAALIVTPGNVTVGGGGGAGEYARGVFSAATIGVSQAITVGVGGTPSPGLDGGNGGTSSIGALMSAAGGTGGNAGLEAVNSIGFGGPGGSGGTGGDFRGAGSNGANGTYYSLSGVGSSGAGGDAQFAPGGLEISVLQGGGVNNGLPGAPLSAEGGAGGSGATNNDTGITAQSGGAGAAGMALITEFL